MIFGLRREKMLGQLFLQLLSKIFNLCGHDPPTSQTDRQTDRRTDDMRSQDYSASRGKKKKHLLKNRILPFTLLDGGGIISETVVECESWPF